jgi:O-methyltransferase
LRSFTIPLECHWIVQDEQKEKRIQGRQIFMDANFSKLRSPDFTFGKLLVLTKAIVDSLRLLLWRRDGESVQFLRLMLTVKPRYTMVTNKNLITLYGLVQRVNSRDVAGDIVECGVWNGGSAAIMGLANATQKKNALNRSIWLFDSFQGLPQATEKDGAIERRSYFEGWNKGDVRKVKQVFTKLGVSLDHVEIIPGWFNDTLKTAAIEQIAILHIDADWYDSVKLVLDVFYDKVVPGGFIILNDYNTWEGCNKALNDFLTERNLKDIAITEVEPTTGAYFQKPMK